MKRRVLSLWQPWATLCVVTDPVFGHAPKQWETRHFPPRLPLPVRIAIHAAKRESELLWLMREGPHQFKEVLSRCGYWYGPDRPGYYAPPLRPLPLGAIIGVATILHVERTENLPLDSKPWTYEKIFGNYAGGRFAWALGDVAQLPNPIPLRGRQDILWQLDAETDSAIDAQLAAA